MYDVGGIVQATQREFQLFAITRGAVSPQGRNRATPENLALLLSALATFTDELVAWRAEMDAKQDWRQRVLETGGLEGLQIIDDDLDAWQRRLDEYIFEVSKAPPGDRRDVLWSVTAPLLLGYYGGPDSQRPRQPADVGTPFAIANRMLVSDEFQGQAFAQWQADTLASAGSAVDITGLIPFAATNAATDAVEEIVDDVFDFAKLLGVLVPIGAVAIVASLLLRTRRRSYA